MVYGEPAGDQAVAIAPGRKGSAVYAEPRIRVWQWPGGPTTQTKSKSATASFLKKEVAPVTAALRTAEKVCLPNSNCPAMISICCCHHTHACLCLIHLRHTA